MSRIPQIFKNHEGLVIPFLTAGFPNLKDTVELVLSAERCGIRMIELGMPFSDPLADGPVIQAASARAIENGVTLDWILDTVREIRKHSEIAIVLMGYINPIQCYGLDRFLKASQLAGVDGMILPDLPPEEASEYLQLCQDYQISPILIVAPNSSDNRISELGQYSKHLLYATSILGVTGSKVISENRDLQKYLKRVKELAGVPFVVGFGIQSRQDVVDILKFADGAVIGSYLLNLIVDAHDPLKIWTQALNELTGKEAEQCSL